MTEQYEEDYFSEDYVPVYTTDDVVNYLVKSGYTPTGVVYIGEKKVKTSLPPVVNELGVIVNWSPEECKRVDIEVDEFNYKTSIDTIYDGRQEKDMSSDWQDYLLEKYSEKYGIRLVNYLTAEEEYTKHNKIAIRNLLRFHIGNKVDVQNQVNEYCGDQYGKKTSSNKKYISSIRDSIVSMKENELRRQYDALKASGKEYEIDKGDNMCLKLVKALDECEMQINKQNHRLETIKNYLAQEWEDSLNGKKM